MNVGEALRSLAQSGPAPLYLVTGPEVYLRQGFIQRLARHVLGDVYDSGLGFHRLREVDGALSSVGAVLRTVPMFGAQRVVVAEGWEPLTSRAKKVNEPAVAVLTQMMEHLGPQSILVFDTADSEKRSAVVQFIREHGAVVNCQTPGSHEAANWLRRRAADRGYALEQPAASMMVATVGSELQRLERELDKVLLYAGEQEVVGTTEVAAVVSGQGQWRIFDLLDAIGQQQSAAALQALSQLLSLGEPPLRVLAMMARHMVQLLQTKLLVEEGTPSAQVRSQLRVPAFVARKLQAQARHFSTEQLMAAVQACYETDLAIKTGKLAPGLAVEVLTSGLVSRQQA